VSPAYAGGVIEPSDASLDLREESNELRGLGENVNILNVHFRRNRGGRLLARRAVDWPDTLHGAGWPLKLGGVGRHVAKGVRLGRVLEAKCAFKDLPRGLRPFQLRERYSGRNSRQTSSRVLDPQTHSSVGSCLAYRQAALLDKGCRVPLIGQLRWTMS
jgi:hypothetical protein